MAASGLLFARLLVHPLQPGIGVPQSKTERRRSGSISRGETFESTRTYRAKQFRFGTKCGRAESRGDRDRKTSAGNRSNFARSAQQFGRLFVRSGLVRRRSARVLCSPRA